MAYIDETKKRVHCKIVYYGVPLAGKTTNMKFIIQHYPAKSKSDLYSDVTETSRFIFCDFVPTEYPEVNDYELYVHLYCTPGAVLFKKTRVEVLKDADGVVFVADSAKHKEKLRQNLESLQELARFIKAQGKDFYEFPLVLQYNKRDLPDAIAIDVINYYLNSNIKKPYYEAISNQGIGVIETLNALIPLVIAKL